jgi:hypothetical protein
MKTTILLPLLLLPACAYARIVKIPHPSAYGHTPGSAGWNEKLAKADRIKGVRFYLPRPYVVVKKEFVVASTTYRISGELKDGHAFHMKGGPDGVKDLLQSIPFHQIHDPLGVMAAREDTAQTSGTSSDPKKADPKPAPPEKDDKPEPKKPLSEATLSAASNPTTSPYHKVGELFDIVLLPDFTEQYAMQTSGGIGYAKADIALENGWLAERVSMEMDNRELGLLMADLARKLADAGMAALSPAAAAAEAVGQSPVIPLQPLRGRNVQLQVQVVEYALPGLHPVLKPDEIFAYQTRKVVVASLLSVGAATHDANQPPPK